MGVGDHGLEPDAEIVDPFERRLEIDLIVLAAWGDGEGQGHLGAGAADRVDAALYRAMEARLSWLSAVKALLVARSWRA